MKDQFRYVVDHQGRNPRFMYRADAGWVEVTLETAKELLQRHCGGTGLTLQTLTEIIRAAEFEPAPIETVTPNQESC